MKRKPKLDILAIEKRIEAQTECRKKGIRHKWVRDGEVANLFYDGKVSGVMRIQHLVCKRCAHTKIVPALELKK